MIRKASFRLILALCLGIVGVAGISMMRSPAAFAASGPNRILCNAGYRFDNLTRYKDSMGQVGPTYRDYNGTPYTATMTLTSEVSGTISLSTTATGEVDSGVILANVKATFSVNVTASITVKQGVNHAITIPPYKAGYGQYGAWQVVTNGHYYYRDDYCNITWDDGYITTYSPTYAIGWNTWTGN